MNFRKVPPQSFQGNFYSLAGPFPIDGPGLHWSYQELIKTKPPERRNQVKYLNIYDFPAKNWQ